MNITLKNISSFPREIITLSEREVSLTRDMACTINTGKVHRGLVGDNIPYLEISDSNYFYKENS